MMRLKILYLICCLWVFSGVVDFLEATENSTEMITLSGCEDRPGTGKKIVLISGDEEYRSEEVLPQLARILAQQHSGPSFWRA